MSTSITIIEARERATEHMRLGGQRAEEAAALLTEARAHDRWARRWLDYAESLRHGGNLSAPDEANA
jgi:hypothetical protein